MLPRRRSVSYSETSAFGRRAERGSSGQLMFLESGLPVSIAVLRLRRAALYAVRPSSGGRIEHYLRCGILMVPFEVRAVSRPIRSPQMTCESVSTCHA